MGKFAKAETQAEKVMERLNPKLRSFGTQRNYKQSLVNVANWCKTEKKGSLRDLTPEYAITYLTKRSEEVGQKTLDMERQAIQAMFKHVSGHLDPNNTRDTLIRVKSELEEVQKGRAYTKQQADIISKAQSNKHSLATRIALNGGLRAHELLTIRPISERSPDLRKVHESKFIGRENTIAYTVKGKGGLVREIRLSPELSKELERTRTKTPISVKDRDIYYQLYYNIGGGSNFSDSFRKASERTLNWNAGAHGLRHSYAQNRMQSILGMGISRKNALEIVSQELGHFRPDITEVYLR